MSLLIYAKESFSGCAWSSSQSTLRSLQGVTKHITVAAGCYSCLQKVTLALTGQEAMKSIPSFDKQRTGLSCCPPGKPSKSPLGSQAALIYPQVSLYKSEAGMPFVTALEMPGQQSHLDVILLTTCNCTFQTIMQGVCP